MNPIPHTLVLASSYLLSVGILWALVQSPIAKYFGDKPDHRKVHQTIIPRLGGIGIILAFLAMMLIRKAMPHEIWPRTHFHLFLPLMFTGVFLLGAGTLDDIHPLNFKLKFLFQFMLAAGIVMLPGHEFTEIAILGHAFELGAFGPALSVLWIVAVMNAINIIDGIDGLAAGTAVMGLAVVGYMSQINGIPGLALICAAMMGATAGFMRFNFSRKHKLFLGDSGSQFLGAVLALLAIHVQSLPSNHNSMFVPLLIVGYPLFDVTVAMVRRFKCGHRKGLKGRILRMFAADNEHLHHRLVYLGLSHVQATFLLLMVAGGIGASAIIISRVGWPWRPMVLGYLAVSLLLILNRLGYIGPRPWLTIPRVKALPNRIVGVIEPDEVFFHSLKSYQQDKFDFLSIPGKLTHFLSDDLVAVLIYNAAPDRFQEDWAKALRAMEFQNCPAVVIADADNIDKLKASHPDGFSHIHFIEKPVRIPELVRVLDSLSQPAAKAKVRPRERRFSLAEVALRNRNRVGQ
jgi:UDP-GlcNAc:undecaprenyl-phosphate GlcNAc-1-phosphate transferase